MMRLPIHSIIIGCSSLLLCAAALAQTAAQEAAIKKQIEDAARAADAKATEQLKKLNAAGSGSSNASIPAPLFNADALPQPKSATLTRQLDVEQIAQTMKGKTQLPSQPSMIAFVSMSMPKPSLERLLSDAERFGVTVMIRGMVGGSIPKTAEAVQQLLGKRQVAWNIDPEAFKRYRVTAVPAYVFIRGGVEATTSCEEDMQCFADKDFLKLTGDVPISYVLDQFKANRAFVTDLTNFERRVSK